MGDDLVARVKDGLRPAVRWVRSARARVEDRLRRPQPELVITSDAQAYWNGDDPILGQNAHLRGAGVFGDDARWLAMGERHLEMYRELALLAGRDPAVPRILEWGCGGGANAVPFAPFSDEYVGVDISPDTLDAFVQEVRSTGRAQPVPVLIDASRPELALDLVPGPADLFLCTYVFELLPTPEYGLRILELAGRLLADDGLALIQIKHETADPSSRSRRFDYRRNLARNATYPIDGFWTASEAAGFRPLAVKLVEDDHLTGDGPYAYFLMEKARPHTG